MLFSAIADSRRRGGIPECLGITINERGTNSVFHFHAGRSVTIRLRTTLLCEIVSHAFTNDNVASIPAIHHPLRDVDAYAGNVFALVCVLHVMDRAAVDSHSHRQTWLRAQSVADLQGAFDRLFH